jgi:hypothetical protein
MSSIAVFLILGGATAFAAKKIGSNEIKGNSITTGKIKKEAVTKAKIKKASVDGSKLADGAVTTTKIANSAVTGEKLATGSISATKLAGGFVAPAAEKLTHYANISATATVLAGSSGISQANVTQTNTGFYCFSGITPAPVGGQAIIDYSEAGADVTVQFDTTNNSLCPNGTQAFVNPRNGAGNPVNAGFFVILY